MSLLSEMGFKAVDKSDCLVVLLQESSQAHVELFSSHLLFDIKNKKYAVTDFCFTVYKKGADDVFTVDIPDIICLTIKDYDFNGNMFNQVNEKLKTI